MNNLCDGTEGTDKDWKAQWADYANLSAAAYRDFFPWTWTLKFSLNNTMELSNDSASNNSASPIHVFPSVTGTLGSLVIVNVVVLVITIAVSHDRLVHCINCGCCGNGISPIWRMTSLFSVALNIAANFVNVIFIRRVPGFADAPMAGLVLLWRTRPRVAWMIAVVMMFAAFPKHYHSSAISALFAEIILQGVGAVYFGRTVRFAAMKKFCLIGHLDNIPSSKDARLMYGGALLWMVLISTAGLCALYAFKWNILLFLVSPLLPLLWCFSEILSKAIDDKKSKNTHPADFRAALRKSISSFSCIMRTKPTFVNRTANALIILNSSI